MKHVFYIHSSICLEMTIRIMEYLDLNTEDVIVLNSRNIKGVPYELMKVQLPGELDFFPFFTLRKLFNFKWLFSKEIVKKWDEIIRENISEKFVFYAQNGRHYKYRVISSHPNCIDVNYFEDGIDFYMTLDEFSKKYKTPLNRRYRFINLILGNVLGIYNRIRQDKSVFPDPFGTSVLFVLSEKAGNFLETILPRKIVLKVPRKTDHIQLTNNSLLLCFSALEEQGVVSNTDMMRGYLDFLSSYNINSDKLLYLRFHPAQTDLSREFIILSLKDYNITILSDDLIIEEFVANQVNDFDIIGCGSSVLNYAIELNNSVRCFAIYRLIEKHSGLTRRSSQWRDTFREETVRLLICQ